MTTHNIFYLIAGLTLALWALAFILFLPAVSKRLRLPFGHAALLLGWMLIAGYIIWLWVALQRPPLRTQGETLLWCTLFLPVIGLLSERLWHTKTALIPTVIFAMGFLVATLLMPASLDKSLAPALRSPWFAPHVIVYMISYAMMALAAAVAGWVLISSYVTKVDLPKSVELVRRLVYFGFPFLTMGMIFGAFWAKIAWGHYWSWDPKEIWAFLTWAMYLAYIHIDRLTNLSSRRHLVIVVLALLVVLGCWFGVNSLPSAQMSVHTYSSN